jgi:hypothetical protein
VAHSTPARLCPRVGANLDIVPDVKKIRRALRHTAGDPLGVGADAELSFAIADAAARRFIMIEHSDEVLREWREAVEEIVAEHVGGDAPEAAAKRVAQRFLLRACEEWAASGRSGTPSDPLREVLVRGAVETTASEPEIAQGVVLAHTASILLDMAWGTDAPVVARVG